jgi:hypothetical protein
MGELCFQQLNVRSIYYYNSPHFNVSLLHGPAALSSNYTTPRTTYMGTVLGLRVAACVRKPVLSN